MQHSPFRIQALFIPLILLFEAQLVGSGRSPGQVQHMVMQDAVKPGFRVVNLLAFPTRQEISKKNLLYRVAGPFGVMADPHRVAEKFGGVSFVGFDHLAIDGPSLGWLRFRTDWWRLFHYINPNRASRRRNDNLGYY